RSCLRRISSATHSSQLLSPAGPARFLPGSQAPSGWPCLHRRTRALLPLANSEPPLSPPPGRRGNLGGAAVAEKKPRIRERPYPPVLFSHASSVARAGGCLKRPQTASDSE